MLHFCEKKVTSQEKDGQIGREPWLKFPHKPYVINLNHEDQIKLVSFAQAYEALSLIRPRNVEYMNGKQEDTNRVVYVGSTCSTRKPGPLRTRILEYCTNGSHKKDLINDTLERGYELWVRVKISQALYNPKKDAERIENELLAMYNYAWNISNNALRSILPKSQHF